MCADSRDNLQCGAPKLRIAAPATQHNSATDNERRKRHRDEGDVEAKNHVMAEPLDQTPGLRQRLNFAQEERDHKQGGRKDEEQLDDGKSSLDCSHGYFVIQSKCSVNRFMRQTNTQNLCGGGLDPIRHRRDEAR